MRVVCETLDVEGVGWCEGEGQVDGDVFWFEVLGCHSELLRLFGSCKDFLDFQSYKSSMKL